MRKLLRKDYLMLLFTIFIWQTGFSQVFITELADPNNNSGVRYIELYNSGSSDIDFTEGSNWRIDKYTNASATVSQTLNLTGTISANGFYIIATGTDDGDFLSVFGISPDQYDGADNNVAGSNGDDNLELYNGAGVLIDQFGVPGEDGSDTDHEFEDGRAERIATVSMGNSTWDINEWTIDSDAPTGNGAIDAPDGFDPGSWIGATSGPSSSANISSFSVPQQQGETTIDATKFTVDFDVPYGTDITSLVPSISISSNATIAPLSDVAQDFSDTVYYTVTAEDLSTQDWKVVGHYVNKMTILLNEDFETQTALNIIDIEGWSNINTIGDTNWIAKTYSSNNYATMTSYGTAEANEVWLVTPAINLEQTINEYFLFDLEADYWKHDGLSILISSDFDGSDVASATWGDSTAHYTLPQSLGYGSLTTMDTMDLSSLSGTIYIAFKYVGDATASQTTTYRVDNVKVTGETPPKTGTDITAFSVPEQTGSTYIDAVGDTIKLDVVFGTDLTSLIPTIALSEGSTISPLSGVAQDFSDTVTYTVIAEDASTSADWVVIVTVAAEPSHEAEILTFSFAEEVEDAVISSANSTITSVVAWNTDVTSLTPVLTKSGGAQVSSTVVLENLNFTNPYTIRIIAQDEIIYKDWVVTVTKAVEPSHEAKLLAFELAELKEAIIINEEAKTVTGVVKAGTDLTKLTPKVTVSDTATFSPEGVQDFSSPVTYTVTAADTLIKVEYVVTLTVGEPDILPIYDIQYTTDASGDSPLKGQTIFTSGIVTAISTNGFYIQDSSSAWNGLYVYLKGHTVLEGDSVVVSGEVQEYFNLTEIGKTAVTVISSKNALPDPVVLDLGDAGEAYEGVFTKILNVECSDVLDKFKEWDVKNAGTDTLAVGDELLSYTPALGDKYSSITGVLTYTYDEYKILPRSEEDIVRILSSEADILTFKFTEQFSDAVIDASKATVSIVVIEGTDITALTPQITVSVGAQVSQTVTDFTNPVTLKVYAEDGTSKDWKVSVSVNVGITAIDFSDVKMYPNPVNGQLTIDNIDGVNQIVITNVIGQVVEMREVMSNSLNIDTGNYDKGIYMVTLINTKGEKFTRRIIKQ